MNVDMWYLATRLFSTQMVCERTHMSYSFFPLFFFFLILAIARKRGHCSVVLEDGVMRLFEMRVMVYTPRPGGKRWHRASDAHHGSAAARLGDESKHGESHPPR